MFDFDKCQFRMQYEFNVIALIWFILVCLICFAYSKRNTILIPKFMQTNQIANLCNYGICYELIVDYLRLYMYIYVKL